VIGRPDRSDIAEARRLDGLARTLALEGKRGRHRFDFERLWRGTQGLLLAIAIVALGAAALDPAHATEPDGMLILTLMLLPYMGSMVHPGAPTEWEALRMPSRRAAAGIAWGLHAAVKASAGGAAPGPGVAGLAVAAGLLPALLGIGLLWFRAGTDPPDIGRAIRVVAYGSAFVAVVLAAEWLLDRPVPRSRSAPLVGLVSVLALAHLFFAWRALANAREWLRLRRLEPWRASGPAAVAAALAAGLIAMAALVAGIVLAVAPPLTIARLSGEGLTLALVALALAVLPAPLLVAHALRRVATVQVADSPGLVGPPSSSDGAMGRVPTVVAGASLPAEAAVAWDREPPVRPGGGWWRAGWVRERMYEPPLWRGVLARLGPGPAGRRLLTLPLLPLAFLARGLRYLYQARGLLMAFGAVVLTSHSKSVGVHWFPFLALVAPNPFAADPSERTWLLGRDLRAAHRHDLRSFLMCAALLPLLAGALALPLGDPHWGPAALVLFAATLLFRLGWAGYRRWSSLPGPVGTAVFLALVAAAVLAGLGMLVSNRWREFVLTNPYPLSAILAVVGAAGLALHPATLPEERLLDEMRGAAREDDDDGDDD
jgi:hypothetical protein